MSGEACRIRPLTEDELPLILTWRNDPAVRSVMFTSHEINLDEHRHWFARASQDPFRRLLLVEDADAPIGYVQLTNVKEGGISDWGFYVAPTAPRGTGRRLGQAALHHAFGTLGLHKLCGQALSTNTPSIRLHEALGFVQEGLLRHQHRSRNEYLDVICFGLLASEWSRLTKEE
ncbi:UDP-4-amino-4,6-dideoxy-N-acetyl-beta-L-altrosamine N-acetyltransferase [uncultured Paracoccus sp.]|uniref:UDP-4-amino-4, 6-dideoxy-N-acetyl-beta-L-altrosamine N-acetyltransferase n=1 Tax=uncultured Paracoccus sp. TaxID=189685 RepID=UPI00260B3CC8|nr:UDP-4-amino-4,6-dideoxy-N-acetyl-beta-L-altrosamine N-acetyltransferase [uncultured Paracoccus sp.]